ncbi:tetratricopeptide repeat protein [Polynucleobacter sp. AM-26B4]|uniref:tetratricopeptide repeat protein n=1 Tax=Polynucleobacter sp. AM-26B4 TaxID=2689103 RepID=UPI001C0B8BC4|nr:tetratricopeptide repeat protein [Polynucleobacter sp. AM-26B4]MBU3585063.1 tetratricopeptide repeat protein [Polynucleobacter sp. AM-26B4]
MDTNNEHLLRLAEENYLRGNYPFAEEVLKNLIKVDGLNSKANELLAYIYGKKGDFETSLQLLRNATKSKNCSPESLYYLGSCLLKIESFEEALQAFKDSLEKAGDFFEGLHDAGIACSRLGKTQDALNYYKAAFNCNKNSPELYFNIALIYDQLEKYEDAIKNYDESIKLDSSNYQAWLNKGVSLKEIGKYDEALLHFDHAINLQPEYFKAWGNKGAALNEMKRHGEALECYEEALRINSDYVEAWSNKGLTLNNLRQFDTAIECIEKAITLNPQYVEAWLNKAIVLNDLKRFEEAIQCCNAAIKIDSTHHETIYNKSLINLSNKNFDSGFKDYESRFKKINFSFPLDLNEVPVWNGLKKNSQILVVGEQGLGDEIFYSRFLNNHATDNQITTLVDKRLVNIFSRSFPKVKFLSRGSHLEKSSFDYQIPMGSLAKLTIKNLLDVEKLSGQFLTTTPLATNKFNNTAQFKCGISWKSTNKEIGNAKSIDLIDLKEIFNNSESDFINLQYGNVQDELAKVSSLSRNPIRQINGIDLFNDIDELLSIIESCNIIITTCNITAHLAGSIGKKTLLIAPYSRGRIWYWHYDKINVWYPSIKQFFQDSDFTWNNAIREITKELEQEIARKN